MCDQTGKEPDPDEMPPALGDYPPEVQVAFLLHDFLPERWEGMNGFYMGKDYSGLQVLLDAYEVEDKKTCVYFIRCIDSYNMKKINGEQDKKRKAEERKAKAKAGAGKKPGINVQG
jgi:hypothetical protein|tara:strand:+ start:126 stop:473 length:348 start_codon:yes stop_codon:yes gene_type:complete